jgi:hypothetical protein
MLLGPGTSGIEAVGFTDVAGHRPDPVQQVRDLPRMKTPT